MTKKIRQRHSPTLKLKDEHSEPWKTPSQKSVGSLAFENARRVLEGHENMDLIGADRDAFLDALSNPPKPIARLVGALRLHRNNVSGQ